MDRYSTGVGAHLVCEVPSRDLLGQEVGVRGTMRQHSRGRVTVSPGGGGGLQVIIVIRPFHSLGTGSGG